MFFPLRSGLTARVKGQPGAQMNGSSSSLPGQGGSSGSGGNQQQHQFQNRQQHQFQNHQPVFQNSPHAQAYQQHWAAQLQAIGARQGLGGARAGPVASSPRVGGASPAIPSAGQFASPSFPGAGLPNGGAGAGQVEVIEVRTCEGWVSCFRGIRETSLVC